MGTIVSSDIEAEQAALRGLLDLIDRGKQVKELYDRAQMVAPEPLKRLLGVNGAGERSKTANASHIDPPKIKLPEKASPDWVHIDLRDATPTSVTLAVLRAAKGPMRSRDVISLVLEFQPSVTSGSISNLGTRLSKEGVIERKEEGWVLLDETKAGIISDRHFFAPVGILNSHELAAHRREAIVHILRYFPTGLQVVQLVEQLKNCSWVQAKANKDLLKLDLQTLDEQGKVKKRGNSKKWGLAHDEVKE